MAGGAVGGEAARRALEQAARDAAARVEGGGAPSATAQCGRRALGAERRLRVLHLFAGPARDDSLAAEFEETPPAVLQICGRWDSDLWQVYTRQCIDQTLKYTVRASKCADTAVEEIFDDYTQPAVVAAGV